MRRPYRPTFQTPASKPYPPQAHPAKYTHPAKGFLWCCHRAAIAANVLYWRRNEGGQVWAKPAFWHEMYPVKYCMFCGSPMDPKPDPQGEGPHKLRGQRPGMPGIPPENGRAMMEHFASGGTVDTYKF